MFLSTGYGSMFLEPLSAHPPADRKTRISRSSINASPMFVAVCFMCFICLLIVSFVCYFLSFYSRREGRQFKDLSRSLSHPAKDLILQR